MAGFGISDFEYVFSLGQRVAQFFKDMKGAPDDFKALKAEAECLGVCLKVLEYRDCRAVLEETTKNQVRDLRIILQGCELNMVELNKFVAVSKRIILDSTGAVIPTHGRGKRQWLSQMWSKFRFVWKGNKQPMREKLAIPTQSLNIFLVSLTFISYRNIKGSTLGFVPSSVRGLENWELIGRKVAFKDAEFNPLELSQPGIEEDIVAYALYVVRGGTSFRGKIKTAGKKAAGVSKLPRRSRPKSTIGKGVVPDPDGMYLVRPKNLARSRSRVRSSVEIVKANHDFESGSESDYELYDDSRTPPSHDPHSPRNHIPYETREPYFDSSERAHRRRQESRSHNFPPEEKESRDEEELRETKNRGARYARTEIKKERKEAIREMRHEMEEEKVAESYRKRTSGDTSAETEVDVRGFLEIRYGVIIEVCSNEEAHINASRAHYEEEETKRREKSHILEEVATSDTSSDDDSGPAIELNIGRDRRKSRVDVESFAIPRHEYISRTERFEFRQTSMDRDASLREREESMRDREQSLRERELALRERERRALAEREQMLFEVRRRPHEHREMPYPPPEERGGRPIIVEDEIRGSQAGTRSPERGHLRPRNHPGHPRRSATYAGPEHVEIVQDDSFDPRYDERIQRVYTNDESESRYSERGYPRSEIRHETGRRHRGAYDSDDDESVDFMTGPPRGR